MAGAEMGAIAAAAAAEKNRQEEEDMTAYNKEDLEGWEFKIVRSNFGRFHNYQRVQELCREEAKAGWEMVEKFDDYRIRFKRRVERRSGDAHLSTDPYRTQIGVGGGGMAALAISIVAAIVLCVALVAYLAERGSAPDFKPILILPALLAILGLFVVIILKRKR